MDAESGRERLPLILVSGLARIEYYPFTAWQMYSGRNRTGKVEYERVLQRDASGRVSEADLGDCVGVYRAARYRDIVWMAFDQNKTAVLDEFLQTCGARQNRGKSSSDRVVSYEIERWLWNWKESPLAPDPGTRTRRYVYQLAEE
jgi:hypothetical protein